MNPQTLHRFNTPFWRVSALALAIVLLTLAGGSRADAPPPSVVALQHGWAQAFYAPEGSAREPAFQALEAQAAKAVAELPGRAEPLIWQGIIESSHAKFASSLTALSLIKQAREHLQAAEKIDPAALDGSVYTSLGSLYAKAPGWPLAFGDKKLARSYLEKALKLNPDGIDPNYFYGELLVAQGDREAGKARLEHALAAAPRAGREDADSGRRAEIRTALAALN